MPLLQQSKKVKIGNIIENLDFSKMGPRRQIRDQILMEVRESKYREKLVGCQIRKLTREVWLHISDCFEISQHRRRKFTP
mmetsp:Transcript_5233/g.5804  ORF Transcript_5233/g.5804 Transcript_5233/m.5804 type:complete len:80 (+) Transcript_5233:176-415(+)